MRTTRGFRATADARQANLNRLVDFRKSKRGIHLTAKSRVFHKVDSVFFSIFAGYTLLYFSISQAMPCVKK